MYKLLKNKVTLVILLLSLTGLGTFKVLAKANSASEFIGSKAKDLCYTWHKDLNKFQLAEKDRVNRIEQALVEIEARRCSYCPYVVIRLLEKEDLEEGSRLREKIDGLIKQRNFCFARIIPEMINDFDFTFPLEILGDFTEPSKNDLSKINIYEFSFDWWKKELIFATLHSNNGSSAASKYVVDILSEFEHHNKFLDHNGILRAVIKCNPLDKDIISAVLSQSIHMNKVNMELTRKSIDEIYPSYKAELIRLNTVTEWNKYKNDNFIKANKYGQKGWYFTTPINWNWDEDGTFDFLNQLLANGFTVVKGK